MLDQNQEMRGIAALTALLLGLLVACQEPPQEPTSEAVDPLVVGFMPWRDADGQTREPDVLAARLAFSDLNVAGGLEVDGGLRAVKLVVAPTSESPEEALENATRLVNQDRVVAIVGPYTSEAARAVASYVEEVSVPMLTPTATAPEVTRGRRFAFRATFVDNAQGLAMATFLRREVDIERAALLYDVTRDYSVGIASSFRDSFVELGGELVYDEGLTPDSPNIDELVLGLRRSNPSIVFLPNAPDLSVAIVRSARRAGLETRFAGSDTWSVLVTLLDPDVAPLFEGSFYVSAWHPDAPDEGSRRFVDAYRAMSGEVPRATQALTYDSFELLFAAIESADATSPVAIRDALADIVDHEGVTGTFAYRGSGDPEKAVVILEHEAEGSRFERMIRLPSASGAVTRTP